MPKDQQHKTPSLFSSLPYEIYHHILSYIVLLDDSSSNLFQITKDMQTTVAIFQSLCWKISKLKEMEHYFNTFWWKIYERQFGFNPIHKEELEKLKEEMIGNGQLRRKVLLANHIKCKILSDTSLHNFSEIVIVMLGAGGVGKSATTMCFEERVFKEEYHPNYGNVHKPRCMVDGCLTTFDIIDTAGQEEYVAMRDQYMKHGQCFIMVCDVTDPNYTITQVARSLIENLIECRQSSEFPLVFALHKVDLLDNSNRSHIVEECKQLVNAIIKELNLENVAIIESSAKTGENIELLFVEGTRRKRCYGYFKNIELLKKVINEDTSCMEQLIMSLNKEDKRKKNSSKKCSLM